MSISLADSITIKLFNGVLASEYNSNLILLYQPQENSIIYYNNPSIMTLIRGGKTIAYTKKSNNLFTLDFAMSGQIMSAITKAIGVTDRGQPTDLISKNKYICLWHWQLAHVSNT